ncbi:hypothetical protein SCALM49S_06777 [Streptomyces californicus]
MLGFTRVRRHTIAATATTVALAVALVGCSSDGDEKDGAKDSAKSGGAFPVSIKSSLGTAKIEEKPERIVTLGQGSAETAIALGETPVGIESYPWGSDKSGYLPWIDEAVKKSGDKLPKQFTGGEEIDFEAITELEPDVILAPWSGITQKQYDVLKDIAPTVAYPDQAWSTDWDQQIDIIGKALGRTEDTDGLKTKIEKQLADAAATRPNYKDVTFSYIYNSGPGTLGVFKPEEQRVKMVSSLGLKVDPVVHTASRRRPAPTRPSSAWRTPRSSRTATSSSRSTRTRRTARRSRAKKLYAAIPAIKKGAVVASNDNSFVTASSIINPLTVPWTIERYLPLIDKAVKTPPPSNPGRVSGPPSPQGTLPFHGNRRPVGIYTMAIGGAYLGYLLVREWRRGVPPEAARDRSRRAGSGAVRRAGVRPRGGVRRRVGPVATGHVQVRGPYCPPWSRA